MLSTLNFNDEEFTKALKCARGKYQLALLRGVYEWNGQDLTGNAWRWSWQYELSRRALITRLNEKGIKFVFFTLQWNTLKPLLLIGISREVVHGDTLRNDFLGGLKYSNATDALKIAIAKQTMFGNFPSKEQEFLTKIHRVKAWNRHNHLDWKEIKDAKRNGNRKQSLPQRNRSSNIEVTF